MKYNKLSAIDILKLNHRVSVQSPGETTYVSFVNLASGENQRIAFGTKKTGVLIRRDNINYWLPNEGKPSKDCQSMLNDIVDNNPFSMSEIRAKLLSLVHVNLGSSYRRQYSDKRKTNTATNIGGRIIKFYGLTTTVACNVTNAINEDFALNGLTSFKMVKINGEGVYNASIQVIHSNGD